MTLQFVSWSRRGVGAGTAAGSAGSRRLVTVDFVVTATTAAPVGAAPPAPATTVSQPASSAPMAVLGPGDVRGIDPSLVVRRAPRPDDHQFEANYLAGVEFGHPDLPWLFSPTAAAGPEHAAPWLMLVVLDTDPQHPQGRLTTRPGSRGPVLEVFSGAALADPVDAWAFAHVQVHGATVAAGGGVDPAPAVRSRLLCPTRLSPDRGYLACVVPVYEAGRRVGLGLPEADAGAAPWTAVDGLLLPAYDAWTFRTGPAGDFETLARKLAPLTGTELAALRLGERQVAVEAAASLMQPVGAAEALFAPAVHGFPTAIGRPARLGPLAPGSTDPQAAPLQTRLKELVDLVAAATDDDPVVGPPLYGRWPAEVTSLDGDPGDPAPVAVPPAGAQGWVEQLNADPAMRSPAGVSTRVVQRDSEELMRDAWSQLATVVAANRRIRWAGVFAAAAAPLHDRLGGVPAASALRLTAPAHGRLREQAGPAPEPPQTVRAEIDASTLPRVVLAAAFTRSARTAARRARAGAPVPAAPGAPGATAVTTVSVTGRAVQALGVSAPSVLPSRYTTARAVSPAALAAVLDSPLLRERVSTALGEPAADHLKRLEEVPRLVADLAAHPGRLAQPAGPTGPAGGSAHDHLDPAPVDAAPVDAAPVDAVPVDAAPVGDAPGHLLDGPLAAGRALLEDGLRATRSLADRAGPLLSGLVDRLPAPVADRLPGGLFDRSDDKDVAVDPTLRRLADVLGADDRVASALGLGDRLTAVALGTLGVAAPPLARTLGVGDDADGGVLKVAARELRKRLTPLGAALELPTPTVFDPAAAGRAVAVLEPAAAYERLLLYAHGDPGGRVRQRSPVHPAMASPHVGGAFVDRVARLDKEWVLGGVARLPPNSVSLLEVDWAVVEAFLAGANHELARELLWRGYPTDLRGTPFDRLWPTHAPGGTDPAPDVAPMDSWTGPLGSNPAGPARSELAVVVIRGDLLRRYPSTLISAELGTTTAEEGATSFVSDRQVAHELFRGTLGSDVTYSALDISLPTLRAHPDPAGDRHCWYISLLQPHDEPHFGLEDSGPVNVDPAGHYELTDERNWASLDPGLTRLTPAAVFAHDSSAVLGASLFRTPFRLLLRAPDYLPPEV